MENLVQQRVSQKTLSHQPLLIVLVHLQLPIQHSAHITELSLMILKIARNFASSISVSEKTSCLKKDSALTAQTQTSTLANIVIKVNLNARYAERIILQPVTTHRGQKTIPAKLHPPVLKCAKTDPVIPVLGLFWKYRTSQILLRKPTSKTEIVLPPT